MVAGAESLHSRFFSTGTRLISAEDFSEIAELDLNPLLVFSHGITAVDLKLRLAVGGQEPDAT
jgi:hypothetical protein